MQVLFEPGATPFHTRDSEAVALERAQSPAVLTRIW
jgi:hypothetical protein